MFPSLDPISGNEVLVRLVPMGTFPTARFEIEGSQIIGPSFDGTSGDVSSTCPLLSGVHNAVRFVEVLICSGFDVIDVALLWIEACYVSSVWVGEMGVSVGHPFRDEAPHSGALLHPNSRSRP